MIFCVTLTSTTSPKPATSADPRPAPSLVNDFPEYVQRLTIDYSKPRWENNADVSLSLHFEVKNNNPQPLEFVKIEASFYDKQGNFLRSETPYIERWEHLSAGDRSPAEVMTRYDPKIASVSMRFTAKGSQPFEKIDLIATQVDRIK